MNLYTEEMFESNKDKTLEQLGFDKAENIYKYDTIGDFSKAFILGWYNSLMSKNDVYFKNSGISDFKDFDGNISEMALSGLDVFLPLNNKQFLAMVSDNVAMLAQWQENSINLAENDTYSGDIFSLLQVIRENLGADSLPDFTNPSDTLKNVVCEMITLIAELIEENLDDSDDYDVKQAIIDVDVDEALDAEL